MKKRKLPLLLPLLMALASCGAEDASSSSGNSSSSREEKGDVGYRYLRSDLLAFLDYSKIRIEDSSLSFKETFKSAVISKGLFGSEDPHFLSISSKESKIGIAPKNVSTILDGLKETSFKNLKIQNFVQKAEISMENVDSSFLFEGKECSSEAYLKDGTFYFYPNEDTYRFLKWGIKYILPKYGYDTSSYVLPSEGLKKTVEEETISSIDQSGLLPLSKTLSFVLPSLFSTILESDATLSSSYEIYAGKPVYTFGAASSDVATPLKSAIESLLSLSFEGEEWEKTKEALETKALPLLDTISESSLSLRVVYDRKAIQRASIDCQIHFDQKKMESYILSFDDVEAGDASIPLSLSLAMKPSFVFDGPEGISFPDFSKYEEFVLPPKR